MAYLIYFIYVYYINKLLQLQILYDKSSTVSLDLNLEPCLP